VVPPINNTGSMVASQMKDGWLTPEVMRSPEWLWANGWETSSEARYSGIMVAGAGGREDVAETYIRPVSSG
jgi:hypothetical protein